MLRYIALILMVALGCSSAPVECATETCEEIEMTNLSASGSIKPGSSQVVHLQPGPLTPGNYTVQFTVNDPNTIATMGGVDFVRLRAEINWKVSGVSVRRLIDCDDGASISGVAEGADVRVYSDGLTASSPNALPVDVTISIGKGSRAANQMQPIYSTDIVTVVAAGATAQVIPVPANAGVNCVFVAVYPAVPGTAIGAYDIRVQQVTPTAISLKSYDPRQTDWVPLQGGASEIRLLTSAAGPAVLAQVTFGIDG